MAQTQQKLTVEVSKIINAPIERVFRAWTDPEMIGKWLGGGMVERVDIQGEVRVGGRYRIDTIKCDAKPGVISGEYKEIVPNKKVVFTWTHENADIPTRDTLVTVDFAEKGNGTEVRIRHTNFIAQEVADRHNMGWTASLDKMAELLSN